MKALISLALFLGASLLTAAEAKSYLEARLAALPPEIVTYYNDVNFIACFSRPGERALVHQALQNASHGLKSERLQKIAVMMGRVKQCLDDVDPAFVKGYEPAVREAGGLAEIDFISIGKGRIRLEVTRRLIPSGDNASLISSLGKQDGTAVLEKTVDKISKSKGTQEVHVWHQIHGRWIRNPASIVLLKSAK
jgi:hypothetical protein